MQKSTTEVTYDEPEYCFKHLFDCRRHERKVSPASRRGQVARAFPQRSKNLRATRRSRFDVQRLEEILDELMALTDWKKP
jgi:hypothetical protein